MIRWREVPTTTAVALGIAAGIALLLVGELVVESAAEFGREASKAGDQTARQARVENERRRESASRALDSRRARVKDCIDAKKKLAPDTWISDELEARFTDECIKAETGSP